MIAQLIARLEHEQAENRRLSSLLTTRDAELTLAKKRFEELRHNAEALAKSLDQNNDTLL
ncbi:hypothetical protein EVA_06457 [gut metagenome]|uniref:Uncharacterized protein n=1 Tax=gut metagenome TaxID=749906 RepID=J9GXH1_9ZZZZ